MEFQIITTVIVVILWWVLSHGSKQDAAEAERIVNDLLDVRIAVSMYDLSGSRAELDSPKMMSTYLGKLNTDRYDLVLTSVEKGGNPAYIGRSLVGVRLWPPLNRRGVKKKIAALAAERGVLNNGGYLFTVADADTVYMWRE